MQPPYSRPNFISETEKQRATFFFICVGYTIASENQWLTWPNSNKAYYNLGILFIYFYVCIFGDNAQLDLKAYFKCSQLKNKNLNEVKFTSLIILKALNWVNTKYALPRPLTLRKACKLHSNRLLKLALAYKMESVFFLKLQNRFLDQMITSNELFTETEKALSQSYLTNNLFIKKNYPKVAKYLSLDYQLFLQLKQNQQKRFNGFY